MVSWDLTMENHHFLWENQLEMAIFNSYVSLPGVFGCILRYCQTTPAGASGILRQVFVHEDLKVN